MEQHIEVDLHDQRVSYEQDSLLESNIDKNPFIQYKKWYDDASKCKGIREANAMVLCTASKDGFPSGRPVLLKEFDDDGFIFFTNYESRKSREMKENPKACLVFFWDALERTVRIEGEVQMITEEQSKHYFQQRPKGSQIGAWASHQSTVIEGRDVLNNKYQEIEKQYAGADVLPRPEFWGGWRVVPIGIEFWQGRKNRLHDRIYYKRENITSHEWTSQRLAP